MKGEEETDQTDSISDIQVVGNTATARVTVHSAANPNRERSSQP